MSRLLIGMLLVLLAVQQVDSFAVERSPSRGTQVQVGDVAPAKIGGTLCSGDWIGVEKSDFKGKFVLVVYWSFDDDARRKAWESKLKDIRKDHINNADFRILSICMDDDFEKWRKFLNDAGPLERNGEKIEFYRDQLWWQANSIDWEPPESVVEKTRLPVAHLVSKYGRFIAVRIPFEDLQRTVAAKVPANPPQRGELVLRAVDIDTGKPIPGVTFSVENTMAEDWAEPVGISDEHGTLRLQTVNRPGYYYSVYPRLKGYDVAGLDDVYIPVSPGRVATHTFLLRSEKSKPKLPPIVALPLEYRHHVRVPNLRNQPNAINRASPVDDMPGFEGQPVTFIFHCDKTGKVSASQFAAAEKIFVNAQRVKAGVRDQLAYFQKAMPEDGNDINGMNDIRIEVREKGAIFGEKGATFWCRLPHGMKLRDGYGISFDDELDHWNLYVPDYQQPNYGRE
jgi:hypothetical protein